MICPVYDQDSGREIMGRKKRKTVVAPKVVMQTSRAQQVLWFALLITGLLLAVWYSYDYGRRHARSDTLPAVAGGSESEQRITALEQERDRLKARVGELERAVQTSRQALDTARTRIRTLEQVAAAPDNSSETERTAAVSATTDEDLQLSAVRIASTDSAERFRFSFSVLYGGADAETVTGNIWISVNGLSEGEPTRLPLNKVSANSRPYLKMSVNGQQDIEEEVTLPPAFVPRNIMIEAKPFDKRYREVTGKFDWVTGG
jgi:hypothetical protein